MDNRRLIKTRHWILAGCFFAICLTQFGLSTQTEFLDSDDWFLIHMGRSTAETPVSEWSHPLTRFWSEEPTWRPVSVILNTAEWTIFGDNAHARVGFHCLLHAVCAILVFFLTTHWFQSEDTGFWASILYITHPIHAQSLGWFHAGFESIPITLAILITLWLFTQNKRTWLVLLAFQIALLVRENALCVPFLITAMAWSRTQKLGKLRHVLRATAPYWILLGINAAIRFWMIHQEKLLQADLMKSFHITNDPIGAALTVFSQPWIPIHPSIEQATIGWWLFVLLIGGLILAHIRWGTGTNLKKAIVFFTLASLPFVLQIHDSLWSEETVIDDYDSRWYFYHLCVAGLVGWPASIFSNKKKWGTGVLIALSLAFFAAQMVHIHWWASKGTLVRSIQSAMDTSTESDVGLVIVQESGNSDLADQIFLTRSIRLERNTDTTKTYKATTIPIQDASIAYTTAREEVRWRPVETIPNDITWWVWNEQKNKIEPLGQNQIASHD